ncbi:MAG: hypothetical protein CSA49_05630 [Gammaproteobacteria bacterium]|nr:MAG: hypothetical protein CSA49_05630 [Gammaproteobacteria bacterium]
MLNKLKPEINFCACGCEARLVKEKNSNGRSRFKYYVQCLDDSCGNTAKETPFPWQAILEWNLSSKSEFPDDFKLPFMNFTGMSAAEMQSAMQGKYHQVEKEIEKLQGNRNQKNNERLKVLRLQLSWLRYGQSWVADRFGLDDTAREAAV